MMEDAGDRLTGWEAGAVFNSSCRTADEISQSNAAEMELAFTEGMDRIFTKWEG